MYIFKYTEYIYMSVMYVYINNSLYIYVIFIKHSLPIMVAHSSR